MKRIINLRNLLVILLSLTGSLSFAQTGTVTFTVLTPVCNHNGVVVASIVGSGSPGYTYNWYTNDGSFTNTTAALTDTLTNFSGGWINVNVIPTNGSNPSYGNISVPFPFQLNTTVVADTCPLQTGAISIAITGGMAPYSYSWTLNGNPFPGNTNALTGLTGGYYNCTISDMAGCQMNLSDLDSGNAGTLVPSVNSIINSISTTPANCINGTATITPSGGQAPYTFLWSNGQTTAAATNLTAYTQYVATVTDANGCFKNSYVYLQSTTSITVNTSVTNAHCTNNDGAITTIPTGGTAPYNYLWNTFATTSSVTNLIAGTYIVTVTDANSCVRVRYVTVAALTPVNAVISPSASSCTGATGTLSASVSGGTPPYNYQWFSNPVQTTTSATGLAPGNYNFLITDAQGCIRSGNANVPQNTTLAVSLWTTASMCTANNGTAMLNASGGVLPYTYSWSTGQTTAAINNQPPSFIYGTVTDANGCHFTKCEVINQSTNLQFILSPTNASCIYTPDGSITVNVTSGTAPFSYSWSTGATTSTITGLLPGYYYLSITDAMGCTNGHSVQVGYASVSPCTGTITGRVFVDQNGNCNYDPGELTMANIPVRCNTTGAISYTNSSGIYTFYVPAGSVSIQQLPVEYRFQTCPSTNPFIVNMPSTGVVINQDIADTVLWVNDLTVDVWNWTPPIVGSTYVQRIVEFNKGIPSAATTNLLDYDPQTPLGSATPGMSSLNPVTHQATFTNAMHLPLTQREINVYYSVPATVPINTTLYYTDTIFPVIGDTTWWDNSIFKQVTTLGSFDPNYKEVSPSGVGPMGLISQADSVLEYVIHFQNVGNYYANNIAILDELDPNLDWSSLRVKYSTHPVVTTISGAGQLQFSFNNIYLPSIAQDTLLSNGFVVYTIHLKPGLANGTQIKNHADIYFDLNAPVTTNTTLNTIQITGLPQINSYSGLDLYPNPTAGEVTINVNGMSGQNVKIDLYNVYGQLAAHLFEGTVATDSFVLNNTTETLSDGIYFVRLQSPSGTKTARLVKLNK
ncbi:MAG TPA: T9SS type A sorting domain-containing protein [Bacteroidia bacterium]|nr:T9SS type A sorting domain-containing protein [Bacteroidia bacterium]